MSHDFSQKLFQFGDAHYTYRTYKGKECRGLMDYISDGYGWSKCSMMDFSRYITAEDTQKPCIRGTKLAFIRMNG